MQYFPPYLFDHEKPFSHRITILSYILLKMWSLAVLQDKEFRPEYELAISLSHYRVRLTLLFSLALLSQ